MHDSLVVLGFGSVVEDGRFSVGGRRTLIVLATGSCDLSRKSFLWLLCFLPAFQQAKYIHCSITESLLLILGFIICSIRDFEISLHITFP